MFVVATLKFTITMKKLFCCIILTNFFESYNLFVLGVAFGLSIHTVLKMIKYLFFEFPDLWISPYVYGTFTLAIYCIDFALILVKLPICTYPRPPVVQESNNAFVVWQVTTRWRCCRLKRKNVSFLPQGKLIDR